MIALMVVVVFGLRPSGPPEVACTNSRCVVVAPAPASVPVVRGLADWTGEGWRR